MYRRQKKKELNRDLKYNPYLPQNSDFFDVKKAKLKMDYKKFQSKPRFSVIIPTYNRKKSLKFVLNNFLKQNYPKSKYEVIIIDDGSNDKTFESIRKIKPTCNFKYFYWPRKKLKVKKEFEKWALFYNRAGLARNIGINNTQGDILLFNDADILVKKDCLKKHDQYHKKCDNIIVRSIRMFLPANFEADFEKIQDFRFMDRMSDFEKSPYERNLHCRLYDLSVEGWQRIITSNLSLRKKYIEKTGGFSRDFVFWGFEDVDLGYRLKQLNLRFIWDDKIKVYHLYHPREAGNKLKDYQVFKIGANILYNKYQDNEIIRVFTDVINRRFN